MKKNVKQYQGYHTHPSQDSSSLTLEDGTVLVKHDVRKREGLIITQLGLAGGLTSADMAIRLNGVFPKGGYNTNHVFHALKRLQVDGVVALNGHTWTLLPKGKDRWMKIKKNIRNFRGTK